MTTTRPRRWLSSLTEHVKCNVTFVRQMDLQLAPELERRVGLPVDDFVLAPNEDMFTVQASGLARFLRGDLVGSYVGFPVTIAWRHPRDERAIAPTDVVTGDDVQFQWHALPADQIRAEETRPIAPPFDLTRYSFAIEFRHRVDDVRLSLRLRHDADAELLARLARELHHPIESLGPRETRISIAMKDAGYEALPPILARLDQLGLIESVKIH